MEKSSFLSAGKKRLEEFRKKQSQKSAALKSSQPEVARHSKPTEAVSSASSAVGNTPDLNGGSIESSISPTESHREVTEFANSKNLSGQSIASAHLSEVKECDVAIRTDSQVVDSHTNSSSESGAGNYGGIAPPLFNIEKSSSGKMKDNEEKGTDKREVEGPIEILRTPGVIRLTAPSAVIKKEDDGSADPEGFHTPEGTPTARDSEQGRARTFGIAEGNSDSTFSMDTDDISQLQQVSASPTVTGQGELLRPVSSMSPSSSTRLEAVPLLTHMRGAASSKWLTRRQGPNHIVPHSNNEPSANNSLVVSKSFGEIETEKKDKYVERLEVKVAELQRRLSSVLDMQPLGWTQDAVRLDMERKSERIRSLEKELALVKSEGGGGEGFGRLKLYTSGEMRSSTTNSATIVDLVERHTMEMNEVKRLLKERDERVAFLENDRHVALERFKQEVRSDQDEETKRLLKMQADMHKSAMELTKQVSTAAQRYKRLELDKFKLEADVAEKEAALEGERMRSERLEEDLAISRGQHETMMLTVAALQEARAKDVAERNAVDDSLAATLKSLAEMEAELVAIKKLNSELMVAKEEISTLREENSTSGEGWKQAELLREQNEGLVQQVLRLQSYVASKESEGEALGGKLSQTEALLSARNSEVDVLSAHAERMGDETAKLSVQYEAVKEELNQAQQKLAGVREKLSMAVKKGKEVVLQRDELKTTLLARQVEVENITTAWQSEKNELEKQLASKQEALDVQTNKLEDLEKSLSSLRTEGASNLESMQHQMQLEIHQREMAVLDFQKQVVDAHQECDALKTKLIGAEQTIDLLEINVDESENRVASLTEEFKKTITELQIALTETSTELVKEKSKSQYLEEIVREKDRLTLDSSQNVAALEHRVSESVQTIQDLEKEASVLKRTLQDFEKRTSVVLSEQEEKMVRLRDENFALEAKIQGLEAALEDANKKGSLLEMELVEAQGRASSLSTVAMEAAAETDAAKKTVVELTDEVKNSEVAVASLTDQIQYLREELQQAQRKEEDWALEKRRWEMMTEISGTELESSRAELACVVAERNVFAERVKELDASMSKQTVEQKSIAEKFAMHIADTEKNIDVLEEKLQMSLAMLRGEGAEKEALELELSVSKQQLTERSVELEAAVSKVQTLSREVDMLKNAAAKKEYALSGELESLRAVLMVQQDKLEASRTEAGKLSSEIRELGDNLVRKEEELSAIQVELTREVMAKQEKLDESFVQELTCLRKIFTSLQADIESERSMVLAESGAENEELSRAMEGMQRLERELFTLEGCLKAQEASETAREMLFQVGAETACAEVQQHKDSAQRKSIALEQMRSVLETYKAETAKLNQSLHIAGLKAALLTEELEKERRQALGTRCRTASLEDALNTANVKLEQLTESLEEMQVMATQAGFQAQQFQQAVASKDMKIEELEKALSLASVTAREDAARLCELDLKEQEVKQNLLLEAAEQRVNKLECDLQNLQAKLAAVEQEALKGEEVVLEVEDELGKARSQTAAMIVQQEIQHQRVQQLEMVIGEAEAKYEADIGAKETELLAARRRVNQVEGELKSLQETLTIRDSQLVIAEASCTEAKKLACELEELKVAMTFSAEELSKLRANLEEYKNEIKNLNAKERGLLIEASKLKVELSEALDREKKWETETSMLKDNINDMEKLTTQLENYKVEEAKWKRDVEALTTENDRMKAELAGTVELLRKSRSEELSLRSRLAELEEMFAESIRATEYHKEMELKIGAEAQKLDADLKVSGREKEELELKVRNLKGENGKLLAEMDQVLVELEIVKGKLQTSMEDAAVANRKLESKTKSLTNALKAANTRISILEREASQSSELIVNLRAELESKEAMFESIRERKDALDSEIGPLMDRVKVLEDLLEHKDHELAVERDKARLSETGKVKAGNVQCVLDNAEASIADLELELKKLKESSMLQLVEMEAVIAALENQVKTEADAKGKAEAQAQAEATERHIAQKKLEEVETKMVALNKKAKNALSNARAKAAAEAKAAAAAKTLAEELEGRENEAIKEAAKVKDALAAARKLAEELEEREALAMKEAVRVKDALAAAELRQQAAVLAQSMVEQKLDVVAAQVEEVKLVTDDMLVVAKACWEAGGQAGEDLKNTLVTESEKTLISRAEDWTLGLTTAWKRVAEILRATKEAKKHAEQQAREAESLREALSAAETKIKVVEENLKVESAKTIGRPQAPVIENNGMTDSERTDSNISGGEDIAKLKGDLAKSQEQVTILREKLQRAVKKGKTIEQQKLTLEKDLTAMEEMLILKSERHREDSNIEAINNEVADLRMALASKEELVSGLAEGRDTAESKAREMQRKVDELEQKGKRTEVEIEALHSKIKERNELVEILQGKLEEREGKAQQMKPIADGRLQVLRQEEKSLKLRPQEMEECAQKTLKEKVESDMSLVDQKCFDKRVDAQSREAELENNTEDHMSAAVNVEIEKLTLQIAQLECKLKINEEEAEEALALARKAGEEEMARVIWEIQSTAADKLEFVLSEAKKEAESELAVAVESGASEVNATMKKVKGLEDALENMREREGLIMLELGKEKDKAEYEKNENQKLHEELVRKGEHMDFAKAQIKQLEVQVGKLQQLIAEKTTEVMGSARKTTDARNELDAVKKAAAEMRLSLTAEIEELAGRLSVCEKELFKQVELFHKEKARSEQLEKEVVGLKEDLEDKEANLRHVSAGRSKALAKLTATADKLKEIHEQSEAIVCEAESKLQAKETELKELREECKNLRDTVESQETTLQQVTRELEALEKTNVEVVQLRREVHELEDEGGDLRDNLRAREAELGKLKKELGELTSERNGLLETVNEKEVEIQELHAGLGTRREGFLNDQGDGQEMEVDQLRNKVRELTSEVEGLRASVQWRDAEIEELRQESQGLMAEAEEWRTSAERKDSQLQELTLEIQTLLAEAQALRDGQDLKESEGEKMTEDADGGDVAHRVEMLKRGDKSPAPVPASPSKMMPLGNVRKTPGKNSHDFEAIDVDSPGSSSSSPRNIGWSDDTLTGVQRFAPISVAYPHLPSMVNSAMDSFDRLSLTLAKMLMTNPGARIGLLIYWLGLHLWMAATLSTLRV